MWDFRLLPPLLLALSSAKVASIHCPKLCKCQSTIVRCIGQQLTTIPQISNDAVTIDIRFNELSSLSERACGERPALRSLLLGDNRLRVLRAGVFHGLSNLQNLYLNKNRINHIDAGVFSDVPNLKQLYLYSNDLHHLAPGTFASLHYLERLYINDNKIETMKAEALGAAPRLQSLRLDGNPLSCGCTMDWLLRMTFRRTLQLIAVCQHPPALSGISISALKEQDLHCQPPAIMSVSHDMDVEYGTDAMLICEATGDPAPEIIWLYNDNHIPLDNQRYEVMDNGTLMIHNAEHTDEGLFQCMARNAMGEVHSDPTRMTIKNYPHSVAGSPIFVVEPSNQIVRKDQKLVRFDCQAAGTPHPHISWFLNGERILLDGRKRVSRNGTLFIQNVQAVDAGTFTCEAENIFGNTSTSAVLTVYSPPSLAKSPENITATVGDRVEFNCKASGTPTPSIKWYKDTTLIVTNENQILNNDNSVLIFVSVSLEDSGAIYCRAENIIGVVDAIGSLHVTEAIASAPKIFVRPGNTEAYRETTVQLPCEVDSEQPAEVEWRKDGSRIILGNRTAITATGSLIISNLTLADTGAYECSVFNDYGSDTATGFLRVNDAVLPTEEYINIAFTEATRDVDQAISRTIEQLFNHNSSDKLDIHDLFRIARYPNAPARDIARAAEVYERTLKKVREFIERGMIASHAETFDYQNALPAKYLDLIARLSGCTAHREERNCSNLYFHEKYRTFDGSCNNFNNTTWGSSLTGFRRILAPIYENGFTQPVGWDKNVKYNGFSLPSARAVSTSVISTIDISQDVEISHMTMQWGQWLDHDLDHSLPAVSSQTWDGIDCKKTCDYAAPCFPIDVPQNDTRIKNRRCIDFIRTSSVCGSGMTSALFGKLQPREQINQLTSFLDASQVYGFEWAIAEDLRELTNENGHLRVGATFPGRKPLLPTTGINGMDCRRNLDESTRNCFVAGDIRANEQIGLAAMHTIWMREHNRIATKLKTINPFWDGDKIYQESRKIVGAEMQFITYEHWLPLVLGQEGYQKLGRYTGYNSNLNPAISNAFATAAFRFGHSMINPILHRYDENFDAIPQGHLMLRHAFFSPWRIMDEGGVDPLLRGMFMTPAKLKTPTQSLNSELTERLFQSAHAVALDLAAINIQRSRDHAIPPYTQWREFCNMTKVDTFDDLKNEISDKNVRDKLKNLYGSPHNIDIWVGGILEDQVDGGKVGPLFQCLLIEQFTRLRDGDRFWYENTSSGFKPEQLAQIKQTSLARVLCDNGDNIDTITENVFLLPEVQDGLIECDGLQAIDLNYWATCDGCTDKIPVQSEGF